MKDRVGLQYKDLKSLKSVRLTHTTFDHWELNFNIMKEDKTVQYIRKRCQAANPYYMTENEPNRWKPILIYVIAIIPIQITFIYYFFFEIGIPSN